MKVWVVEYNTHDDGRLTYIMSSERKGLGKAKYCFRMRAAGEWVGMHAAYLNTGVEETCKEWETWLTQQRCIDYPEMGHPIGCGCHQCTSHLRFCVHVHDKI